MKEKPTHQIRIGGVKAAIWRNKNENGDTRFTAKFSRIYKTGDVWKSTEHFGRDDLQPLSKVADQVHTWVNQQEQWAAATKKSAAETGTATPAK